MPVIKSARKKLRKDKKRQKLNESVRSAFKNLVKKARKNPTEKNIREAAKTADKAAGKGIIHKNKAARIKSSLAKLSGKTTAIRTPGKKTPVKKIKPLRKK